MKTDATENLFQRCSNFFGQVRQEGRKVSWPSRRETFLTTAFVFVFAVVAAIYFLIVDQVIYRLLNVIFGH